MNKVKKKYCYLFVYVFKANNSEDSENWFKRIYADDIDVAYRIALDGVLKFKKDLKRSESFVLSSIVLEKVEEI